MLFLSHQEADLVTTHELGHNFGAEHDPDNIPYCAPSDDQGGKFVMYPIAVSGDHVNNKVTIHFCNIKTYMLGKPDIISYFQGSDASSLPKVNTVKQH